VVADVEAAAELLASSGTTQGRRVGVVGFCMGGSYALLAACGGRGIAAAVAFYGLLSHEHGLLHDPAGLDPARKPRSPLAAARDLSCPLLAFFGAEDRFVPLEDVRELERRLAGSAQPSEVVVVPGAGHAFMNDTRPDAFRPDSAREAFARTAAFLHANLD
jgi:carboxymethylenebutenolidase